MGKYFGTDGFRGEANLTLTAEHAWRIGRFLGHHFTKERADGKARVVIGKDPRRSSYTLEYALVAGLCASGADAYILHVLPTPAVSYITRVDRFDCGIMISASHNPYKDNGIKLFDARGEKMGEELITALENFLDSDNALPFATGERIGVAVDYISGRNRYLGYLISLSAASYRGKRVGLDCANGAAFMMARAVFDALGATTYVINDTPNGLNINQNAGSTHIEVLQSFVRQNGLDVGFAFDGDADRCIAVDERGCVVDGDAILYMMAKYMKERGLLQHNTVVTTVMSNFGLYKALEKQNIRYEKTDVGDKNVYECMMKNGYRLGGEQSGHVIFSKIANTGDGLITAIKLMELMCNTEKSLRELTAEYTVYPQVLENVRVKDKEATVQDPCVLSAIAQAESELGKTGRILVRASGTEPLVRVMVEAECVEICRKYVFDVIAVMRKRGLLL